MNNRKACKNLFVCRLCGKTLSSKQNLQQHTAVHTGEKPLKCPFPNCSASFTHASQLSTHKAIHRKNLPNKLDFTNLKNFIHLILELIDFDHKPVYHVPAGPYSFEDCKLPEIKSTHGEVKLPMIKTTDHKLS